MTRKNKSELQQATICAVRCFKSQTAYSDLLQAQQKCGGIDIQLLGIGSNGHIAFNEPADSFQRWSHVVELKESTIKDNSRFFNSIEEVPTKAVTMGIGSIMQAKRILIIALGEHKAKAIKQLIDGNVTPKCPASVLQFHTDVTLMLDKGAASLI